MVLGLSLSGYAQQAPQTDGNNSQIDIQNNFVFPQPSGQAFPNTDTEIPDEQYATIIGHAKMSEDTADIDDGLVWRLFSPHPNEQGQLPMIDRYNGATPHFRIPAGDYYLNVAFGRAIKTLPLQVLAGETSENTIILDAGGLLIKAQLINGIIDHDELEILVYAGNDESAQALVLKTHNYDKIIRLHGGDYVIVANYGALNASQRTNIRVENGKVTETNIELRAAPVTLKLVSQQGGEALAETRWSILNSTGDMIFESNNAYASMVLSEGDYVAIAKNRESIFEQEFSVSSGQDLELEILASDQNRQQSGDQGGMVDIPLD